MKKRVIGVGAAIILIVLLLLLTGCGNENSTTNTKGSENITDNAGVTENNSTYADEFLNQLYVNQETIDLSEYEDYGSFKGEDYANQIAWVCKSDYNGRRYGYINRKGEFIIPLSSDIRYMTNTSNELNDYENGKVVVSTLSQGFIIYDTEGDIVAQYKDTSGVYEAKTLSNGNIIITNHDLIYPDVYMYVESTNEITKLPYDSEIGTNGNYSDGLLACMINDEIVYLDEQGNEKLRIDNLDNSAYLSLSRGGDFKDGKATLKFFGKDRKYYEVTIDTNGNWLDEPVFVGEDTSYSGR